MKQIYFSILLFLMGVTSPLFAQRWGAKVMTPSEDILLNKRVEIGINPDGKTMQLIHEYLNGDPHRRDGLNPFVSWDINITAVFTHEESNKVYRGIAFWFTDMERDELNGYWKQRSTSKPFRIRFAPPITGEWNVEITANVKEEAINIGSLTFTTKESSYKGHVKVSDGNRYLQRGNEVIMPMGVNLPFPYVDNNLLYSQDRDEKLKLSAWKEYRSMIQQYLAEGGKHFRFFIHPSSTDIEFEEVGYYQNRQHFAWEVDKIIEICEENGALIDFNLMAHTMMMRMGDYHQYKYDFTDNWHDKSAWPYKDINHVSGYSKILNSKRPSDMFLQEKAFKYLRQKTRYIMARWGYSTAISIVELTSEPWHIDENWYTHVTPYDSLTQEGDQARRAIYKYHKDISSYIKDSLQINSKLIGAVGRLPVGPTKVYSHLTTRRPKQIDSTWHDPNIDIISISYYSSSPEKAILSKNSSNNECDSGENSMACVINRLHNFYDKPVIFGEADHGDGTHICSELEGHLIDAKRFSFTGAAGHFIWAAFNYPYPTNQQPQDERKSWKGIIDVMQFYNSRFMRDLYEDRFIQGREKLPFKGSREALIEHQYLIDSSRNDAAGYIYNRTFNVHTAGDGNVSKESRCFISNPDFQDTVTVTWKPQRTKIEGLRSWKKYRISYYGYRKGLFLLEQETRSSLFGKIKIKHPALIPKKDRTPIIWYTIEQY